MIIGEKNTDLKRLTGRLKLDRNWAISLKPRRKSRPLRLVWWALVGAVAQNDGGYLDSGIIYVTKTICKLHTSVISWSFTHNVLNKTFLNLFLW